MATNPLNLSQELQPAPEAQVAPYTAPEAWRWPPVPTHFKVYDKYTDVEQTLSADESVWKIPVRGKISYLNFEPDQVGVVQKTILTQTQAGRAASTITKFGQMLVRHWPIYSALLSCAPEDLRTAWDRLINEPDMAWAGKKVLGYACLSSAGHWEPRHQDFVKALDHHAAKRLLAHRARVANRDKVLSVQTQAAIVKILDNAAAAVNELDESDAEAFSALALAFQHAMRPAQLLPLKTHHLQFPTNATNELSCHVSFHAAKQRGGKTFELPRQVKPEWVPIVKAAHANAARQGRDRFFVSKSANELWNRVKRACAKHGLDIGFTHYSLRHTAAQSLADAAHDRTSIKSYLGHTAEGSARAYLQASLSQAERLNAALGVSKLYDNVLALAERKFASVEEIERADEDSQIGAVVGDRIVAGVGLCRSGQPSCPYNPVTSCYGCSKFMPSLDRAVHEEAVAGMRAQVLVYVQKGMDDASPAYRQLTKALSGAQQALAVIDSLKKEAE